MQELQTDTIKLKTLATCKPSEFLKQTNRIKKSAEKWLKMTDIIKIRQKQPAGIKEVPKDATDEEALKIRVENRKLLAEQAKKNLSEILDSIMDDHPDETLELLALFCFVEPENVDYYPVKVYMSALTELLSDEAVINFFSLLLQMGQKIN
jgi:hypothetical protein